LLVSLTPTTRATNQVQFTAHVDMSKPNEITGNAKLAANALDFTRYYDLFGGQSKNASAKPAPPQPPSKPAPAPAPPAGAGRQMRDFTVQGNIGRIYLHELEITNFELLTRLNGDQIVLDPCKLWLNGAPVATTVKLDRGTNGQRYDLNFSAQAIPLAPLVNSFQPERKGILSGTLTAAANVKGEGTSGESLQKTLAGKFDIASTNLNLAVENIPNDSVYARPIKVVLNAIVLLPDLIKNPGNATSLLQGLVGGLGGNRASDATASTGSGPLDLRKSPINVIALRGDMGAGKIQLQ
jgi:hypothetical protein